MDIAVGFVIGIVVATLIVVAKGARVVQQYERGVVFRLGRVRQRVRQPGFHVIVPFFDRMRKVNIQIITMPIPAQEGITRDNVTVRVDAVVYFRVHDPARAIVEVQNHVFAIEQVAQTSLRSIIGKSDLDDLLSNREELHRGLALMIDSPAVGWGVEIDRVELKDVQLPESMKRSMSRQAEAERERRSRIITADGEFQASKKLAAAADEMSQSPAALQLRLLQTVVEVAAEKNSTLVMPFPVEMLRFFENFPNGGGGPEPRDPAVARAAVKAVAQAAARVADGGESRGEEGSADERAAAVAASASALGDEDRPVTAVVSAVPPMPPAPRVPPVPAAPPIVPPAAPPVKPRQDEGFPPSDHG
ncbi:slipin family protein [Embleya sp. NPDC020630]|uniref:slipin family protein n=1 Tax=Embleya sp. NPDC020630 TaxID=3363979 RepID=UPI0037B70504